MNMKDLYNDSIVRFKKTGNLYKILSSRCEMKNPVTREWMQAVIYETYKDAQGREVGEKNVYVREKQEFMERFELVLDL